MTFVATTFRPHSSNHLSMPASGLHPATSANMPEVFDPGQYTTLLEITRSITFSRELETLLDELATHLHRLLEFDFLALVLHDDERNVMRMRVASCPVADKE